MKKPLALIIEDDLSSANLYKRLFRIAGYECKLCTTFKAAQKSLEQTVPALVVLDMRLEHYNRGPKLLEYLKSNEAFNETRIIIISAYSTMVEDYEHEADLVILKPVNARNLLIYAEDVQLDG